MEVPPEVLMVVSDSTDYEGVVDRLRHYAAVTQLLPPRLALVALSEEQRSATPVVPGVTWYVDDAPSPAVLDRLSPQEQIFVAGWTARLHRKERTGDQLPWDAPGHMPPDWPRTAPR